MTRCFGLEPTVYGNIFSVKTDSLGNTLWTTTFGDGYYFEIGKSVQQTFDEGYIIAGITESFGEGGKDVYLIKTNMETGIEERYNPNILVIFINELNTFHSKITIKYELSKRNLVHTSIYNILGQAVRELGNEIKDKGTYTIIWDGKDNKGNKLSSGVYLVMIEAYKSKALRKILLIR